MTNKKNLKIMAQILLVLSAFIWGSSIVVTKDVLNNLPPFWILSIRFGGGALLLSIIFYKKFRLLNLDYIYKGGLMGFFLFLTYALQTVGLNYTTPSKNAFLIVIYCVIVPLLYWVVDKKKPDKYNIFAGVLCLSGIGFISLTGDLSLNIGDILTLFGGVAFACSIVTVAKFIQNRDLFLLTIIQFISFTGFSLIIAISTSKLSLDLFVGTTWQLLYLVIFGACGAFLFQNIGQKYVSPSSASILISLEAPFAVSLSILTGLEVLTPMMFFGFVLIFLSIICSETKFSFLKNKSTHNI